MTGKVDSSIQGKILRDALKALGELAEAATQESGEATDSTSEAEMSAFRPAHQN